MDIFYVDGQFIPSDQAMVSANDLTVLRGYGVFDFLITYNRKPFHLSDHISRLFNSANEIDLRINYSKEKIAAAVHETINRNPHHKESNIRLVHTGGISSDGITPQDNGVLYIMVTAKPSPPGHWYTEGAKVITLESERFIPTAKTTNYTTAVLAQASARKQDAIEAIYVDHQKRLLEGTTSNFFLVKSGEIITADENVLSGVTRDVLLTLMNGQFNSILRDIHLSELKEADEAFLSASNKEIVPIIRMDNQQIGDGKPGPVTERVMALFKSYTEAYGRNEIE